MNCKKCKGKVKVIDTVHTPQNEIIRKRKCKECGRIFYTVEKEVRETAKLMFTYHEYWRHQYD